MLTTEEWQELAAKVRSEVAPAIIHIENREQDLAEDPIAEAIRTGDEADAQTNRRSLDHDKIDEIRRRISEGESVRSIAREMGMSPKTVIKYKPAA